MRETMRAVRIHRFGGPEELRLETVPRPEARRGELLLRVRAAGVNPVDWKTRAGRGSVAPRLSDGLPFIMGWDVSGTVEAVGADVPGFVPGDEVFGMVGFPQVGGAYAEFVAAPAEHVARKPSSLSHLEAAALPLVSLTSWQALFEAGGLEAGQKVLIHAAAGGVGHVAVQLARWRGARVAGTASAANHDFLRELGAEQLVDYRVSRFEEEVEDVDVVLDSLGGEVREHSWQVLRPGGVLVSILGDPASTIAEVLGVRAAHILVEPDAAQLGQIAALAEQELLRPTIHEVFPLAEAQRAHELGERGHTRGKIVLEIA